MDLNRVVCEYVCREREGERSSRSAEREGDPLDSEISVSEVSRFILYKSQYL